MSDFRAPSAQNLLSICKGARVFGISQIVDIIMPIYCSRYYCSMSEIAKVSKLTRQQNRNILRKLQYAKIINYNKRKYFMTKTQKDNFTLFLTAIIILGRDATT